MDFEGLLPLLILLWLALGWLGRRARARRTHGAETEVATEMEPAELEADEPAADDFDRLRAELEQRLGLRHRSEQGPLGRAARSTLPGAEEVEERATLGGEREVISLEEGWERPERLLEARDAEEAERLVQRRLRAAEARLKGRTRADHAAFDQRIRAAPPPLAPRQAALARIPLRQAVLWREVLGPPKALQ